MDKCKCEWCSRKPNKSGNGYCRVHYDQMRKYGHILDIRTGNAPSEVVTSEQVAYIIIRDKRGNEIERAIIDVDDVDKVNGKRWTDNGHGYVRTFKGTTPVYLHRLIMDAPDGYDVDHVNRNRLDNRRSNLRVVSHIENANNRNCAKPKRVTGRNLAKPYYAVQTIGGERKYLGYFATEEEAARVLAKDRTLRVDKRFALTGSMAPKNECFNPPV